ncbi:MAG TPA: FkbM family methyltransferase [Herbaspirillum sp.]|jgi:FkbM family methyltransferase
MLSTSHKIRIARGLSASVLFARGLFRLPADAIVIRDGITWSLNLKEGIDLAIYLLGGFELRTLRRYAQLIKPGDVVLDIGANVGAHTLPLAKLVGDSGRVISFEPTAYAFAKQQTNIALNPQLAPRISAHQMMLTATDTSMLPDSVYSSWPLEQADDLHNQHHGRLMATNGASLGTLDSFISNAGIEKIDFIKLDVDGNENDVLLGAENLIKQLKPRIMLELAPYVYGENPHKFDGLLNDLWHHGYEISDMATGCLLPRNSTEIRKLIPEAGGLNVLAICR